MVGQTRSKTKNETLGGARPASPRAMSFHHTQVLDLIHERHREELEEAMHIWEGERRRMGLVEGVYHMVDRHDSKAFLYSQAHLIH
jgi:hypothetical protein